MHDHVVQLGCNFLVPAVSLPGGPSFHRLTLSLDRRHPENGGTLTLDPNSCGLDEFGDTTICTKMAVPARQVRLTLLKEKDDRRVYDIEAIEGLPPDRSADPEGGHPPPLPVLVPMPLRLVTLAAPEGKPMQARLLALAEDKTITRIIDLYQT